MIEEAKEVIKNLKDKGIDCIHVNFWDDFYEDGYVPEGEIQKTYAYVEDSKISDDDKELLMMCVHGYLVENFKEELEGVEVTYGGDEMYFKHLTHKKLDLIMSELEKIELTFGGIPYSIYSES